MKIEKLTIYEIALPFSGKFPHALNSGGYAKNVVCEIIAEGGGIRGYGEGAPRAYVTGETSRSISNDIVNFVKQHNFCTELADVSQLWSFIDYLPKDKSHHAAICALETALLDALGKKEGKNLSDYFPAEFSTERIHYGAAIPLWKSNGAKDLCRRIQEHGIHRLKLKMGTDLDQNHDNLKIIQTVFGTDYDLKIDANGSWNLDLALEHLPLFSSYGIRVVEQPMTPGDPSFKDFAQRVTPRGILLMADESACALSDIDEIISQGFTMVNVRLSKCGGFKKSLQMVNLLRTKKIPYQIGCHLGESGILSAAGRVLSLLCKDAVYFDGSYDAFLLRENVTSHPVSFGKGGVAERLPGYGLGVEVDPQQLHRLCEHFSNVEFT